MPTTSMMYITASTPADIFDNIRTNEIYTVYDEHKLIMPAVFCILMNITAKIDSSQRWCAQLAWSVNTAQIYTRSRDETHWWAVWKSINLT